MRGGREERTLLGLNPVTVEASMWLQRQGTEPLNDLRRQKHYFKNFVLAQEPQKKLKKKKKSLLRYSNWSECSAFAAVVVKVKFQNSGHDMHTCKTWNFINKHT